MTLVINNNNNLNNTLIDDFNDYLNKINNNEIEIGLSVFTSSRLIKLNTQLNKQLFDDIKLNILDYRMQLIIDYYNTYINKNNYKNELIKYYKDNITDLYSCIYQPTSLNNKKDIDDDTDDGFLEEMSIRYRYMFPTIEQLKQLYNKYNNQQEEEVCEYNYTVSSYSDNYDTETEYTESLNNYDNEYNEYNEYDEEYLSDEEYY
jgi:hypothetical protein